MEVLEPATYDGCETVVGLHLYIRYLALLLGYPSPGVRDTTETSYYPREPWHIGLPPANPRGRGLSFSYDAILDISRPKLWFPECLLSTG